jgi:hypothetical protein
MDSEPEKIKKYWGLLGNDFGPLSGHLQEGRGVGVFRRNLTFLRIWAFDLNFVIKKSRQIQGDFGPYRGVARRTCPRGGG